MEANRANRLKLGKLKETDKIRERRKNNDDVGRYFSALDGYCEG